MNTAIYIASALLGVLCGWLWRMEFEKWRNRRAAQGAPPEGT